MADVARMIRQARPAVEFPKQNKDDVDKIYTIDKELGSGAYSVVHLGKHKQTGNVYAIKVVDKRNTTAKSMLSEIEVMAQLEHPNVVNFKEIFDTSKGYYVVLEYITGGELFDRIIDLHHYSEKDASKVIRETLLGIQHMHQKGFAHRDLKPENLLLSSREPNASVKVADFGFAKKSVTNTDLTALVGTPPYMAPELVCLRHADAEGGYGREVDLWAIGVILYILLSGIHPFQIEDEEQMLDNIEHNRWQWLGDNWKEVSDSAKDLIKKLMEPNPHKRITVEAALAHPWITGEAASDKNLGAGVRDELKKFQARKKFKGAFRAIAATNRLKLAALSLKRSRSDSQPEDAETPEPESYPYEDLVNGANIPEGIDASKRETYLSNKEFAKLFGMDKEAFSQLPGWKQTNLKRDKKLF